VFMLLTTKGRYAVTAMADIAAYGGEKPVNLTDISSRQSVDIGYLEQIFLRLKKSFLVQSTRGVNGGYRLSRHPSVIKISEIMLAVDESIRMTRCKRDSSEGCAGKKFKCMTHDLWSELEDRIYNYLLSVSLEDITKNTLSDKNK
jgi:Rrf2 family transcriptional regulator, iron-sulfur cluster assembly transcription factor